MATLPAVTHSRYDDPAMVGAIKQTVARGASDAQLRMFLEVCKRTGLDPFLREVWLVADKGIIMAGRDGYLRVANEHPMFDGIVTRVVRGKDKVPIKAICSVFRKDRTHPVTCEAYFNEYVKSTPVWKQYPSAMISKVAEVLALKRSFAINGVVTEEEIGDGSGSAAAAQEVAERKIAEMQKRMPPAPALQPVPPQPCVAAIAELPEFEYEEPPAEDDDLDHQLRESIRQVEALRKPPAKAPSYYQMLQAFGDLRSRYQSLAMEKTYYAILGMHGQTHANGFPATDEGLAEARACYKQMSLDIQDREARAARRA